MNKWAWFLTLSTCAMGSQVFAANGSCTLVPVINFNRTSAAINNFNDSQTIVNAIRVGGLRNCTQPMAVRSNFKAVSGSTNLTATGTGSYPFGVDTNIEINNSTASAAAQNSAKAWVSDNLKLSFDLSDAANSLAVTVAKLDEDYNIHPDTSLIEKATINGEVYLVAAYGLRNAEFGVPNLRTSLINKTIPSIDTINVLNGATVRVHLGTLTYKYDNYYTQPPTGISKIASTELYMNFQFVFNRPTCTMSNQSIDLASISTSALNSQQTGNEKNFDISINCMTSMPSRGLVATIKDSYTASNINTNGILKNRPSLVNRSNVDIQLRDGSDVPLAIGSQASFYSVPAGSTATTFIKALKARYFRSAATATPGYVQTQATVSLDYQ